MKRLLAYLKPHKWVMTAATVLVLFIIVVELYRPIVIVDAMIISTAITHRTSKPLRMRRVLFLIMTLT